MCGGRGGQVMVVEYFDYSGTARKVIYYWEPIKNYLADFIPKFASCFLTKSCHHFSLYLCFFWTESTIFCPFESIYSPF